MLIGPTSVWVSGTNHEPGFGFQGSGVRSRSSFYAPVLVCLANGCAKAVVNAQLLLAAVVCSELATLYGQLSCPSSSFCNMAVPMDTKSCQVLTAERHKSQACHILGRLT